MIGFFLVVSCSTTVSQVQQMSTLGVVHRVELPFIPSIARLIHFSSASTYDVLCYDRSQGVLAVVSKSGDESMKIGTVIGTVNNVTSLTIGNLNNDGLDDIVVVHRDQNQIEVFLSSAKDSTYSSTVYPVNYYPESAVISDIDNDSTNDILCYGKLSSGISVLRGSPNGTYRESKLLFPDVPISAVNVVRLNGDNIADLVIHNWLTNEELFFFGMGNMQFSGQNSIAFDTDSAKIAFGDFNNDGIADFIVSSARNKNIQVFEGDGIGSFHHVQTIESSMSVQDIQLASIHNPALLDVVVVDRNEGMFSISVNRGDGTFFPGILFGGPPDLSEILFGDIDGGGLTDALCCTSNSLAATLFANGNERETPTYRLTGTEVSYAAGKSPLGLMVGDWNNDGVDDIGVVNGLSSTVSLLINPGDGFFSGQLSFDSYEQPAEIRQYSRTDSSLTFLLTHSGKLRVSVITLTSRGDSGQMQYPSYLSYTIPTAGKPTIILPDASHQSKTLEFFVQSGTQQSAIFDYQQVQSTRFVEKSYKPVIPSKLLAGTVADFNNDNKLDLAYAYYDKMSAKYYIGITFSDSLGEYREQTYAYAFDDTLVQQCFLYFEDINGDNIRDCILYTSPNNMIRVALGRGEGRFSPFIPVVQHVTLHAIDQLQCIDFDGDGVNDFLVFDQEKFELILFRGKGNGTFYGEKFLLDLPRDASFRCGDFNSDGALDIVYSNPQNNVVTIYYVRRK